MGNLRLIYLTLIALCCTSILLGQGDSATVIDERLISCTVHITIPAKNPDSNRVGTGFFVATFNNNSMNHVYLVTNKHMIGNWSLISPFSPYDSIIIDLYPKIKGSSIIRKAIKIKTVTGSLDNRVVLHPNPKVDVVVLNVTDMALFNSQSGIFWQMADTAFLIRPDEMQRRKLAYGEHVFAIGYPSDIKIAGTNLPIAKSGYIASSTAGNLRVEFNLQASNNQVVKVSPEGSFYLVDGLIIGGNSGGPVLSTNKSSISFSKDLIIRHLEPSAIVGIVSMVSGTGLSVIYSCDNILDLIIGDVNKRLK